MNQIKKLIFLPLFLLIGISAFAQTTKVFEVVDKMPSFAGGKGVLMQYIASNIHYPSVAEENGIQGRVICTFIVEKDGSISEVTVLQSVDPSLDKEAVRVINSMPKWNPGSIKGEPVRVKYTLPITFGLEKTPASGITMVKDNNGNINKVIKGTSSTSSLIGQLLAFNNGYVTNKIEKGSNNEYERNYYNDDCIDYTLVRGTDKIYTLREGKNTLYTLSREAVARDNSKNGQTIRIYPGKFVNEKKLDAIIYAMPVKNGIETQCTAKSSFYGKDSVEIMNYFFRMNPRDTIYASRSGVACPDVVNNRLFIYHDDGTIALYTNIHKLVKHEDRIIAGQPIGCLLDGKKSTRLSILYLTTNTVKVSINSHFPYKSYYPIFRTTKGDINIDGKMMLTPNTDTALIMQELTSKEKKKLLR